MNPVYFHMALWTIAGAALLGLLLKLYLDNSYSDSEISWREYAAGTAIIALVLTPIVVAVGSGMARDSLKSFNQNINAVVYATEIQRIQCYKDGPCAYTYPCDPTPVARSCDSDGCLH